MKAKPREGDRIIWLGAIVIGLMLTLGAAIGHSGLDDRNSAAAIDAFAVRQELRWHGFGCRIDHPAPHRVDICARTTGSGSAQVDETVTIRYSDATHADTIDAEATAARQVTDSWNKTGEAILSAVFPAEAAEQIRRDWISAASAGGTREEWRLHRTMNGVKIHLTSVVRSATLHAEVV